MYFGGPCGTPSSRPGGVGVGGSSPLSSTRVLRRCVDACTVRSVAETCCRSRGTATGTATRLGFLRTVAYFTGRRTPCHLRKWHAGELPWTGRSCLGVKGSQVQILSARHAKAQVRGRVRRSPERPLTGSVG